MKENQRKVEIPLAQFGTPFLDAVITDLAMMHKIDTWVKTGGVKCVHHGWGSCKRKDIKYTNECDGSSLHSCYRNKEMLEVERIENKGW